MTLEIAQRVLELCIDHVAVREDNDRRTWFKEQFPTPIVVTPTPKLECNVMHKLSALAFIVMITAPLPAIAYTQADADACTPDAMRLCQHAIPDASRVTLCLVQNRRQLSPACTMVFNRPRAASDERPVNVQKTKF
jgi:hypothetical protein